ncbi:MAG: hypothetical protein KC516_03415 [Nanoarchaeota archaeon]|nr:hypothetical protein [Nanoarchaeota archaeon]
MDNKRGMLVESKKGQMKLSFGMIFSIILIIVFLFAAFYAITKFISFQKEIKYRQFSEDLNSDVEKLWKSTQGSNKVSYNLPTGTKEICVTNGDFENVYIHKKRGIVSYQIDHLDEEKTLEGKSSLCFEVLDGKVEFGLKKLSNEAEVTIVKTNA